MPVCSLAPRAGAFFPPAFLCLTCTRTQHGMLPLPKNKFCLTRSLSLSLSLSLSVSVWLKPAVEPRSVRVDFARHDVLDKATQLDNLGGEPLARQTVEHEACCAVAL